MAGAAALRLLLRTLPGAYVGAWAPQALRAVLSVVRSLPEHCTVERASTHGLFLDLMRKVLTGADRGLDEQVGGEMVCGSNECKHATAAQGGSRMVVRFFCQTVSAVDTSFGTSKDLRQIE